MGYGPEIITDENDRLISSIGNWVSEPEPPPSGFIWSADHAIIFSDMGIEYVRGILPKDFFLPISLNATYIITLDAFWPSSSHDGSVSIIIRDAVGNALGIAFAKNPPDVWRSFLGTTDPLEAFDNDSREMYVEMSNIEYLPMEAFVKNLSIREILVGKVQYLPIVGIG